MIGNNLRLNPLSSVGAAEWQASGSADAKELESGLNLHASKQQGAGKYHLVKCGVHAD
jgi:hypothetical protein